MKCGVVFMSKLIHNFAHRISRETGYKDTGIIFFGLQSLISMISGYAVLGVLSFILKVFPHAIIAALVSSSLRVFSGGSHASSPLRCTVFGTVMFLVLGGIAATLAALNSTVLLLTLTILIPVLAMVAIYKYGYATTHKKPLNSYAHGRKLRSAAVTVLFVWLVVIIYLLYFHASNLSCRVFIASILTGIAWHTFCLTPLGHKVNEIADRLLQNLRVK